MGEPMQVVDGATYESSAPLVLTDVLHAFSDPVRLVMVRGLAEPGAERTCGSFDLPIAKSTASHHWGVLRDAGVVRTRVEGTKKFQMLRRDELDAAFPGLLDAVIANSPDD